MLYLFAIYVFLRLKIFAVTTYFDIPNGDNKLMLISTLLPQYYTDPVTGRVFRSKRDVQRYLETGEISRRAVFPKKGPIDEKILVHMNLTLYS